MQLCKSLASVMAALLISTVSNDGALAAPAFGARGLEARQAPNVAPPKWFTILNGVPVPGSLVTSTSTTPVQTPTPTTTTTRAATTTAAPTTTSAPVPTTTSSTTPSLLTIQIKTPTSLSGPANTAAVLAANQNRLTTYSSVPAPLRTVQRTVTTATGRTYTVNRVINSLARGLAWAGDWAFIPNVAANSTQIQWYYAWQDMPIPRMPSDFEYIPMLWGLSKINLWKNVEAMFQQQGLPQYILAQNEPDVPSQANEDPITAAKVWLQYLAKYQDQGVKVSSPAIAWDTTWLQQFFDVLAANGRDVDFIAVHFYGDYNDLAIFQNYIQFIRAKWGKPIWITEYGVRQQENPTMNQTAQFYNTATQWMQQQTYIQRAAYFGAYATNGLPDGYITQYNSFFLPNGTWTAMGQSFMNSTDVTTPFAARRK